MEAIDKKRDEEKKTIAYMISYYCKKKHHRKHELCEECNALLNYAYKRIDLCPLMEQKTFCSACKVHCYQREKREQIREVMRFSGPRMLFHKPVMAIRHVYITRKEKSNR